MPLLGSRVETKTIFYNSNGPHQFSVIAFLNIGTLQFQRHPDSSPRISWEKTDICYSASSYLY